MWPRRADRAARHFGQSRAVGSALSAVLKRLRLQGKLIILVLVGFCSQWLLAGRLVLTIMTTFCFQFEQLELALATDK